MKPGQRYMEAREAAQIEDLRERRLFRPEEWPPEYIPAPGSNDDRGQRNRFGYLSDGMWMNMPSPGTHIEAGISEFFLSQQPPSKCGADFCRFRGCQGYCKMPAPVLHSMPKASKPKRPWWRFW